jgi:hypothetical protein
MSAMKVIDEIRDKGGKMLLFESFCGGLVALNQIQMCGIINSLGLLVMLCLPEGGTAKFIQEGTYKYIPYCKLFRRTEFLEVEGYGRFEAYSNRDFKIQKCIRIRRCTDLI